MQDLQGVKNLAGLRDFSDTAQAAYRQYPETPHKNSTVN
jgi:hypothetical protein